MDIFLMNRRLRIAQVAPLYARIPPSTYGGTERIIHGLTEELVRRGHDVTLFAAAGAQTSARLHITRKEPLYETWQRENWRAEFPHVAAMIEALRYSSRFDLIHFHLGSLSVPLSAIAPVPTLHSLPSPVYPDEAAMLLQSPKARVTARSRAQVEHLPKRRRHAIDIVYNGCDFHFYEFAPGPGRYLAFLGRMGEEKNPLDAIRIAKAAGMPVVLAGAPVEPRDHLYFEAEIRPLIDGRTVNWIGPVNDLQKRELLRDAAALLFPIQWDEAFGIVMIEAMACGVPVLAYECGSVSEVVDAGVTGFYADSLNELIDLVPRALELDRRGVRDHARGRFSLELMADAYLQVYESVITGFRKPAC
jgi:glycosyltransferase involved in cell wall biosynthesis